MAVHNSRWFFLAIACLINLFSGSLFTWSVFAGPKAVQLSALTGADLTAVDLAITFAVCNLMGLERFCKRQSRTGLAVNRRRLSCRSIFVCCGSFSIHNFPCFVLWSLFRHRYGRCLRLIN